MVIRALDPNGMAFRALDRLQSSHLLTSAMRVALLRAAGMAIGGGTRIWPGVAFTGGRLTLGRHCFLNTRVLVDAVAPIEVGDEVRIGFDARLLTSTHAIGGSRSRAGLYRHLPVRIGDGVWIGAAATILPGVEVAAGCIVAAGAVVARATERDGLYAGVPARRVRDL